MAYTWVGIDPGINGVIAHLGPPGRLLAVHKMPTLEAPAAARAGGEVRRVDGAALLALFAQLRPAYAVLEQVQSWGSDTPMTAFSFGYSFGVLEDRLREAGIPVIYAPPSVWKADLGLTSDKKLSKPRAQRLFPSSAELITSVDKAEAALIGLWGKLSGKTPAPI